LDDTYEEGLEYLSDEKVSDHPILYQEEGKIHYNSSNERPETGEIFTN
jgi:hypothetical protein